VQDASDDAEEPITVEASYNPHPVVELVQNASVGLLCEHLTEATRLLVLSDVRDEQNHYTDAIDICQWIVETLKKGIVNCR
jgi:hypothetical protein